MTQSISPKTFETQFRLSQKLTQNLLSLNDAAQQSYKESVDDIKRSQTKLRNQARVISDQMKELIPWLDKNSIVNAIISNIKINLIGYSDKTRVKLMRDTYTREINRNLKILENMINYFYEHKLSAGQSQATLTIQKSNEIVKQDTESYESQRNLSVMSMDNETHQFDQLLIQEKQQDLDQLAQDAQDLQKVAQQIGQQVDDQGQQFDVIEQNQQKVKENLQTTNTQLDSALKTQKFQLLLIKFIREVNKRCCPCCSIF